MDPNEVKQPDASGQPNTQPDQTPDWQQQPQQAAPRPDWQQGLGTTGAVNPQPQQVIRPTAQEPTTPVSGVSEAPSAYDVYNTQMPSGPQESVPTAPVMSGPAKGPRVVLVAVIVVLLLAAIAGAAYVFLKKDKGTDANNAAQNSSNTSEAKDAIAVSSLSGVTFNPPATLSGFQPNSSTKDGYSVYLTDGSADDKACSLEFGTLTAADLPGNDLNSIIAPQIEEFKSTGATVEGPTAGAALVLKDASDPSVTYSLPTLNYKISQDNEHVDTHYSLAILKDGKRAVVSRQCLGTGDVASELSKVEAAAKQLTVTKQ